MEFIVILTSLILCSLPIIKRVFDRLGISFNEKQYELLRKVVEDAVAHVEQLSTIREIPSEAKKLQAISVATNLSQAVGLTKAKREIIADLIETTLWKEKLDDEMEDDDD